MDTGLVDGFLKHVLDLVIFPRYSVIRAYFDRCERIVTSVLEFPAQDSEVGEIGQTSDGDKAGDQPKQLLENTCFRISHS